MADQIVANVFDAAIAEMRKSSRAAIYRTDVTAWAHDVLGIDLWSKQREIAQSLLDNKRTAVKSCHGIGKSQLASILVCWWIATHPLGDAIAVVSAPTYAQIHQIVFRYIGKNHQIAADRGFPLPGHVTAQDRWNIPTESGIIQAAFGRKPADTNMTHAFNGIHERYVLVVLDESCGIVEGLWTAVEAITTTADARILAIGNPDDPNTHFGKVFNDSKYQGQWNLMTVSAFDSPNLTIQHVNDKNSEYYDRAQLDKDIDPEVRKYLIQPDTVESWREQWGEDDPRWKSKILGEFPDQSENSLFSQGVIDTGVQTIVKPDRDLRPVLGVDVARFGDDYSAIYSAETGTVYTVDDDGKETATKHRGKLVRLLKSKFKADGVEVANWIHQTAMETGAEEVRIDVSGLGAPILDFVRTKAENAYRVVGMNGSGPTPDRYHWRNARAWWHDDFRQQMSLGKIDISYDDEKLKNELLGIRYHFKNNWRALQIESKEDMQSRGVKSPDFSDAAIYAAAPIEDIVASPFAMYEIGETISFDTGIFTGRRSTLGPY